MSERGICSRREADHLIEQGLVKVNGEIVEELGTKVESDVKIELLERAKQRLNDKVTVLVNKPIGFVSSQPEKNYRSALELVRPENRSSDETQPLLRSHLIGLGPAGRLDIDSQGLMIYTQDGVLARRIIGENSGMEKEYLVRVTGQLSPNDLQRLRHGLSLEGRPLKPALVEWQNADQLRFVLQEGRKRQIRRMCEMVGLEVVGLKRVRIGQLMLGHLKEGQWRFLKADEYARLDSSAKPAEPRSTRRSPRR